MTRCRCRSRRQEAFRELHTSAIVGAADMRRSKSEVAPLSAHKPRSIRTVRDELAESDGVLTLSRAIKAAVEKPQALANM